MKVFNRRDFLKIVGAGSLGLLSSTLPAFASANNKRRPNVLFILSDDQGSIDVNSYGAKDLITPNLDRMALRGTRFTQFYAAAPVCSPSRAAIMTGRFPQRAGLAGNAPSQRGHEGMSSGQVTIAEIMKSAGYKTGHVGKWHLGYSFDTMPNNQGFDYSFGHMGGCIDNYSHFFFWKGPNRHDLWRNGKEVWYEGQYFGRLMVNECKQFITANKENPFFLYWAINFPHYPLQGLAKWRKRYQNMDYPRNEYAAFISTMDEMIGEIFAHLDKLGLSGDTIVIFQSDHGHSTEIRTGGSGGNAGPYRGAKFSLFEGGIRVPAMISWPGHLPENAVRGQMVTACDWYPTILDLCGISGPEHVIDGKTMVPVIKSSAAAPAHKVFYWANNKNSWAVREGDWKLLGNPVDTSHKAKLTDEDKLFLVNLSEDVSEMKNIAKQHPDKVAHLTQLYEKWLKQVQFDSKR